MKERLDDLLVSLNIACDISDAQRIIMAGKVFVNEELSDKPGKLVKKNCSIRIKEDSAYVSRGGYKLKKALDFFHVHPSGKVCLDIGVSTGGFTDCLLQNGARRVFAVDVGYGQLDWKLRQDSRVILFERYNARKLTTKDISQIIDLAVIDVSFISLTKIIPPILPLFRDQISIIALIKPQFELPRELVEKGGIVTDGSLHQQAINKVIDFCMSIGLKENGHIQSPLFGAKGNKEFLIHLVK